MYEYDLKFPYESQLVIAVKDWESIVGKKSRLIGKTRIDLEDRFYSTCYATCGIAKKYEPGHESGNYNRWRDILTPTQILNKVRQQWRLKKPEYTVDNKLKITTLDEKVVAFCLDSETIEGMLDGIEYKRSTSDGSAMGANGAPRSDSENDPRIIKVN